MFRTDRGLTSLSDLRKVPVTAPPGAGKIWQGVQHGKLLDAVLNSAPAELDVDWGRSKIWVRPDGGDMAAAIAIRQFGGVCRANDWTPYLSLFASNRQKSVLTAYYGMGTAGGAFAHGKSIAYPKDAKWMYTTAFDFKYVCDLIWDHWPTGMGLAQNRLTRLSKGEQALVRPDRLNNLLMQVGREKILPWSRVGVADGVFAKSRDKSLADLLEAVWLPLSLAPPPVQLRKGYRLTCILKDAAGKRAVAV